MKLFYIYLTVLTFFCITGCEQKNDTSADGSQTQSRKNTAACPVCNRQMTEDAYCAECNAIATTETDLVHCNTCDKDFKPGTYCAECNRFMLNAKVGCENCQSLVVKGHYCQTEKLFKGLPDVAYCSEHQTPYSKDLGCTICKNAG